MANPWTVGHEDALSNLHNNINRAVQLRNAAMESNMPENEIMRTKEDLKVARQNMRKELRRLEREWWDNILTQCQEANEKVKLVPCTASCANLEAEIVNRIPEPP